MLQRLSAIFFIVLHMISMLYADECSCNCRGRRPKSICDSVEELWKIADTNAGKLMEWERHRPFVERFSERWKKEISEIVKSEIDKYMSGGKIPIPEKLIMGNEIEEDSMIISKPSEDDSELVHNLLVKVEMVENRTIEVEEELKSERRVRRHLEQEVKETQSSLVFLGDKLNATAPVDAVMDQVQMVIYSSLEDMNKTLYEDHFKKLYYKVDGVAYKNETKDLIERLEHVEVELRDIENVSIVLKLAEDLKTVKENIYHLNNSVGSILIGFEEKFQNFSEEWTRTVEVLQSQVEYLKNETMMNKPEENIEILQVKINKSGNESNTIDDYTYWEPDVVPKVLNKSRLLEDDYDEVVTLDPDLKPHIVDRTRIEEVGEQDYETCEKPLLNDTHLLADVVKDSYGRSYLKFACRPVGLYVVSHLPIPPRCKMGSWKEPFPSCKKLSTLNEIDHLANELIKEHPCSAGSGGHPDPTDCTQFIKCSHGLAMVTACPDDLIYNTKLKVCDYPRRTPCDTSISENVKELQNLIPPIHIEPDIIDKANSHMGTGTGGELIVHPRSSFTLQCIYPQNIWGLPAWSVTNIRQSTNPRVVLAEGEHRVSLTVTAAQEDDSGTYECFTKFGVKHAIEIAVKVVTCPAFIMEDEYEDVFYRPTPEGELRIMGTTAEFFCQGGYIITTQCMADGNWSRSVPSVEECSLKKRNNDNIWNCKSFYLSEHPDLILERDEFEKIITFKCAGGKRLIGNAFTRCRDDGFWSHVSLPRCKH